MNFFDAYELRARIIPSLIVISPYLLLIGGFAPMIFSNLITSSAGMVIFLALLYLFSFVIRQAGRQIEKDLWTSWGGPPSAIVLLDSDITFTNQIKTEICEALVSTLDIKDARHPLWVRGTPEVQQAFGIVRQFIRKNDPDGLWNRHNAEYGFLRNLMGSWWIWFANSLIAVITCGVLWYLKGEALFAALTIAGIVGGIIAIIARTAILPKAARIAAFRYAESAWLSFLATAKKRSVVNHE